MAQSSFQRWPPGHISDQLDRRRIKTVLNRHRLSFWRTDDRLKLNISVEHLLTTFVQTAYRRSNLRVRIIPDIFAQKIDQAGVALKDRKQLHSPCSRF